MLVSGDSGTEFMPGILSWDQNRWAAYPACFCACHECLRKSSSSDLCL